MAGEAVSGRYGAARHAVDEGGPQRSPASGDRSLVDRLLADGGDDAFDWGWGDPAAVTDREPLHDIPELWGPDERSARDSGEPDGPDEKPFPTPRLHGESSLGEGPAGDRDPDGGAGLDRLEPARPAVSRSVERGEDDRDWSDRSLDDLGSDDWGAPAPELEDRRPADLGPEPGDRALDDRRFGDQRLDGRGLDGDPLDALSTGRVLADPGPLGDSARDRDVPERDPLHDARMDGDPAGARPDSDTLDRDSSERPGRSPLAPPLPNRDPLDALGTEPGDDLVSRDTEQPHHPPPSRDPLNHDSPERDYREQSDPRPRNGAPPDAGPRERPQADDDRFEHEPQDRGGNDRDPLGTEPGERKLVAADPRLRRWADRDRPSGPPPERVDRPAAPAPFVDEYAASDPLGADQFGADLLGAGQDRHDAGSAPRDPGPRDADPFADSAFTENALTGRISITDADRPGSDRPRQESTTGDPSRRDMFDEGSLSGRDLFDATPDPTTAFTAVAPAGPAPRDTPEEPAAPLEEYTARRRAAEKAAASAEEAASSAAERASAAIAAAARAAEEAEAAAEAAAKAAAKANDAADAEVRAIADAAARAEAPSQPDGRAEAPEPPTQAVPLIAPARAPGRRPPPRRPAGPPPRGARPDEPGRSGGPPPRAVHRTGPGRDGAVRDAAVRDAAVRDAAVRDAAVRDGEVRDSAVRDSALRGGTDGEATAVLTGLEALRDPVRPRSPEPAPAEVTTIARRRPAAEPAPATDDVDDVDDAEHDEEPEERGLVGRLTSRPVVAAVGVGAVLVLAAIVAIFTTSEPEATPAEATPAAVSAPVAQPQPTVPAIDPQSPKAVAFLTALRDADIPTSSSGQAETEAAAAICAQLDQGADEAQLARSVPAVLPDVTRGQASKVVDFAQKNYC
jgi:hypothetical protein